MAEATGALALPFLPGAVELAAHFEEKLVEQRVAERLAPLREELQARAQQEREALLAEIAALRQAVRALTAARDQLVAARERSLQQAAHAALVLTDKLARRLLDRTLRDDPQCLIRLAARVLAESHHAHGTGPITLHVHPSVYQALHGHSAVRELTELVTADISLVADDRVERGAVLIETESGSLWLEPSRELDWLVEALWAALTDESAEG